MPTGDETLVRDLRERVAQLETDLAAADADREALRGQVAHLEWRLAGHTEGMRRVTAYAWGTPERARWLQPVRDGDIRDAGLGERGAAA